mgnify:CR=1 FL=1
MGGDFGQGRLVGFRFGYRFIGFGRRFFRYGFFDCFGFSGHRIVRRGFDRFGFFGRRFFRYGFNLFGFLRHRFFRYGFRFFRNGYRFCIRFQFDRYYFFCIHR